MNGDIKALAHRDRYLAVITSSGVRMIDLLYVDSSSIDDKSQSKVSFNIQSSKCMQEAFTEYKA